MDFFTCKNVRFPRSHRKKHFYPRHPLWFNYFRIMNLHCALGFMLLNFMLVFNGWWQNPSITVTSKKCMRSSHSMKNFLRWKNLRSILTLTMSSSEVNLPISSSRILPVRSQDEHQSVLLTSSSRNESRFNVGSEKSARSTTFRLIITDTRMVTRSERRESLVTFRWDFISIYSLVYSTFSFHCLNNQLDFSDE